MRQRTDDGGRSSFVYSIHNELPLGDVASFAPIPRKCYPYYMAQSAICNLQFAIKYKSCMSARKKRWVLHDLPRLDFLSPATDRRLPRPAVPAWPARPAEHGVSVDSDYKRGITTHSLKGMDVAARRAAAIAEGEPIAVW